MKGLRVHHVIFRTRANLNQALLLRFSALKRPGFIATFCY
jgi:hypothetical protein